MTPPTLADAIRDATIDATARPFLAAVQTRLRGDGAAPGAIDAAIDVLRGGGTLSDDAARAACLGLIAGDASDAHAGALLALLSPDRLPADTIAVFARAMREHAAPVRPALPPNTPLLDTCGTGGDGLGTFNVSTTVMFVVAAGGVAVAKHGNRAATSRSGSADVLEALGVRIDLDPAEVARCIEETGVGFMFAQRHHQAYRNVQRVRQRLTQEALPGVPARTLFNVLGPLANPAAATHQVLGVSQPVLVPIMAAVLGRLGVVRALVACGETDRPGACMDELSTAGSTRLAELRDGRVLESTVTPEVVGLPRARVADLAGGDAAENAAILRSILDGTPGPRADLVRLNAAAAFYVSGVSDSIAAGVTHAGALIASGAARGKLEALRACSQAFPSRTA